MSKSKFQKVKYDYTVAKKKLTIVKKWHAINEKDPSPNNCDWVRGLTVP